MNWRIPTIVVGLLLAISATFVVFAGPDDGSDDSSAVVEEPGEGDDNGSPPGVDLLPQGDGNHGQEAIARAIADAFSTEGEEILVGDVSALREEGIGFGALFKLYALAAAMDTSVEEVLALRQQGMGFGELRNALDPDQLAILESLPKNLGRIVADLNKPEGNGTDEVTLETGQEKASNQASRGHGRPSNVSNGSPSGVPHGGRNVE